MFCKGNLFLAPGPGVENKDTKKYREGSRIKLHGGNYENSTQS